MLLLAWWIIDLSVISLWLLISDFPLLCEMWLVSMCDLRACVICDFACFVFFDYDYCCVFWLFGQEDEEYEDGWFIDEDGWRCVLCFMWCFLGLYFMMFCLDLLWLEIEFGVLVLFCFEMIPYYVLSEMFVCLFLDANGNVGLMLVVIGIGIVFVV